MTPFHEIDIPKVALLEHEIFLEATRLDALSAASGNILEGKGLKRDEIPPPPYFQTRILSLLYLVILYPHELWEKTELRSKLIDNLEANSALNKICGENLPDFLRHIRNSIAHARVQVTAGGRTTFVDRFKGKETFRTELSLEDVQTLLSAVGSAYAELREKPYRDEALKQLGGRP
ncbi:MAG: HEPN family nuclease [Albidovulum sp.]|uniref:HEPN family nuclease n=1 Tax=Albidovulum sp. TaxID=1872424 RepID=UPI003CB8933B